MKKLKKLTAVLALTGFILCGTAAAFAETDDKVRETANETRRETDNIVRETADETLMETDNKVRETSLTEMTSAAFDDLIAFFGM